MTKNKRLTDEKVMRVAFVVPHIFMHKDILPHVIFSPGQLALSLTAELKKQQVDVTLFTPGPVDTSVQNVTADLSLFERELSGRDDTYMDLLRKHPFTFTTLARQVQSELVAKAYAAANDDEFDLVHIYTNEEEIALPFAKLCKKPVVFTHHDPFNFLVKYKNNFPKYKDLNWISLSYAQREGMPPDTNWVANIYHGLAQLVPGTKRTSYEEEPYSKQEYGKKITLSNTPVSYSRSNYGVSSHYAAYLGRIIEPKGVHLAIQAVKRYNKTAAKQLILRIAGKHYAEESKDTYWREKIEPEIDNETIFYDGFLSTYNEKEEFLTDAQVLLVPSLFDEPFGMVTLEAFACGTPVIALDSGALPEVIDDGKTGFVVKKSLNWNGKVDEPATVKKLVEALKRVDSLDRSMCRKAYETRFTLEKMARVHLNVYEKLIDNTTAS